MKRDILSRFAITPFAGVRIETIFESERKIKNDDHTLRGCAD